MIEKIRGILATIEHAPVECDGFCRLATTLLQREGIDHQCFVGKLLGPEKTLSLHYWIMWDHHIIDYRARMWLGERAPHGVFMESAEYTYQGNQVDLDSLDPRVFSILAGGVG